MVKKFTVLFIVVILGISHAFAQNKQKNVIFVIADGTGPGIMGFLMQYAKLAPGSPYKDRTSNLEKILNRGTMGIVFNTPLKTVVTDSAASGTQLATGVTSYPDAVGIDAQGNPAESLLKKAKKQGKATGLITDVYVLDATPIVFAGNQKSRRDVDALAKDMLQTKPDVVLGGGLNYFISPGIVKDSKYSNIIAKVPYASSLNPKLKTDGVFEEIIKSGYQLVYNKKNLAAAKGPKLFGLFSPDAMPFNIEKGSHNYPTLKEMTQKSIEILSKNKNGFFLMVEAGAIDWVAHANDQGALLKELLEFDETLGYINEWMRANPDTLLVITADHDTGGFGFHYHKPKGNELEVKTEQGYPLYMKTDYVAFENLDIIALQNKTQEKIIKDFNAMSEKSRTPSAIQKVIKENMGYDLPMEYIEDHDDIEDAIKEVNKRLGVVWSSPNHTASPIIVTFYGADEGIKGGVMHSTEVNKRIADFLYGE
jgi:alkaline phosphatase